jgi:hypothetical protein
MSKTTDLGHKTRSSDSSLYDEVCVYCGATDSRGSDALDRPCPAAPKKGENAATVTDEGAKAVAASGARACNGVLPQVGGQPAFVDPPTIYDRPITEHGGGKYLRRMHSADVSGGSINVDVYCVIEAFGVTCPALQHALKKILACGGRGKGGKIDDLHGVFDAMWRALELQRQREAATKTEGAK